MKKEKTEICAGCGKTFPMSKLNKWVGHHCEGDGHYDCDKCMENPPTISWRDIILFGNKRRKKMKKFEIFKVTDKPISQKEINKLKELVKLGRSLAEINKILGREVVKVEITL